MNVKAAKWYVNLCFRILRFNATFYINFWTTCEKNTKPSDIDPKLMNSSLDHYTSVFTILHIILWRSKAAPEDNMPRAESIQTKYCHSLLREQLSSVGTFLASNRSPSQQESAQITATVSSQQLPHLSYVTQVSPSKHKLTAKTGAQGSLIGSWWILLINVNCANLIHRLWLKSHLEYANSFTHRHVLPQTWYHQ